MQFEQRETPIGQWIIFFVILAIFIGHSLLFRDWIIDDAGISYVYARNFAQGYGFVAQPGQMPVEGFSNLTWVLLLIPFYVLNIFHPVIVPKLMSVLLVAGGMFLLRRGIKRLGFGFAIGNFVLLMLALNTPFVIWTSSGLENPLYFFLIIALFYILTSETLSIRQTVIVGVVGSLIALTRPDGMLFLLLFPMWQLWRNSEKWRAMFPMIRNYTVVVALIFGGYVIFRVLYFGDVLPNTYYAKESVGLQYFGQVALLIPVTDFKLVDLIGSAVSLIRMWVLLLTVSFSVWLIAKERFGWNYWLVGVFLFWTLAVYMLLPEDWMGEYRFATAFYPFFYTFLAIVFNGVFNTLSRKTARRIRFFFATLLIVFSAAIFAPRSLIFANSPTVAFQRIGNVYGERFNDYAQRLGIENGSFLLPDLGGTLYYSELEIIDLAGLTDKVIARELYNDDKTKLHEYIFGEKKPTFIHMHGFFSYQAQLEDDPRFRDDYVALCETVDSFVLSTIGEQFAAGQFIRKDAVTDANQEAFEEIQSTIDCN